MKRRGSVRGRWRVGAYGVLSTLLAAGYVLTTPALATEALGDLDLQVRLLDVTPAKSIRSDDAGGVARIEVIVQAFVSARDLRIAILRPDGTPWLVESRPFHPGRPDWSRPGGEPLEPGTGPPSLGPRETARAILRVPLEKLGVQEIVIQVGADGPAGPLRTENAIRAAVGVVLPLGDDDGTNVTFPLEVRP